MISIYSREIVRRILLNYNIRMFTIKTKKAEMTLDKLGKGDQGML